MKNLLKSIIVLSLIVFTSCETQEILEPTTNNSLVTLNKSNADVCPDEENPGNPNHPPEPDPRWIKQITSLTLHRNFRDNILLNNNEYKKYVDYYYLFSKEVSFFDFTWETKVKIWDSRDNLNNSLFNLLDENYTGIIITNDLKNEILSITNDLKELTNNKYMFDEFESDINLAVNKTRQELLQ